MSTDMVSIYRKLAEEVLAEAAAATSDEAKRILLAVADRYAGMAASIENTTMQMPRRPTWQ